MKARIEKNRPIVVTMGEEMEYTGLQIVKLEEKQSYTVNALDNTEQCVVLLYGYGDVAVGNNPLEHIGNRDTVFAEVAPYAIYLGLGDQLTFTATTSVELAICTSPSSKEMPSRIIKPETMSVEHRGYGQIQRTAKNILPETEPAESLLVVEVITKGGNWSSFPSHRHDEDDLPNQSYLEEIYYHKLNPQEGGFALQRVYNDDKSVDEVFVVEHDSAVLVKEGYHPVAVPPGYDLYYLNVMAGPTRTWKFYNDPYFEHLIK
ncbi:5-deoxy-glucuronate isomerase [Erysipelothrix urinaevulpis]|uniref:5-deoxy-glucuronate isomerase n=1 Tax=Erysipelothrix urinaevulpis TaxID=2683717 RepID=UPI001356D76B|nr:5-deoxy-glucuronate isomerase [Erysipelothrix urinaevulpis]